MADEIKFRKDGRPDGRGRSAGSRTTQFAAGDGRKRPGRPKGSKSLGTIYREAAAALVTVARDGKHKRVPTKEAIVLREALQALKGDARARESFMRRLQEYSLPEVQLDETQRLIEEDRQILLQAMARGLIDPSAVQLSEPDAEEKRPQRELDQ
jgi:hypothetical protein